MILKIRAPFTVEQKAGFENPEQNSFEIITDNMNNSGTIDSGYLKDITDKSETLIKIDPTSDSPRHVVTEEAKDSCTSIPSEVYKTLYSILVTEVTFQPHEKGIFNILGLKFNLNLDSIQTNVNIVEFFKTSIIGV